MQLIGEAAEGKTSTTYQVIHVFFEDSYHSDHHLILAVEQGEGESETQTKHKALDKAAKHLQFKRADPSSVEVITQEEYQQSLRSKQQIFYILYQNGTRKYISILATDQTEAKNIFNQRIPGIMLSEIFSRLDFKKLLGNGDWKYFPLTQASQN